MLVTPSPASLNRDHDSIEKDHETGRTHAEC